MEEQLSYSDLEDEINNACNTTDTDETTQPPDNQTPDRNASDERFISDGASPMGDFQLPPFHELKSAIDIKLGRSKPKSPLILSAAALTGQPLIYQPAKVDKAKFIEQQRAKLYVNGVNLTTTPSFISLTTSELGVDFLQEFPQKHRKALDVAYDPTNDTDGKHQVSSSTSDSSEGEENPSCENPKKYNITMERREVKVKLEFEEEISKTCSSNKYQETRHKSAETLTKTNERVTSTLENQATDNTNNNSKSQYRFNESTDGDD